MDQRQTQIREGAGLEESKLNVEFIEWLQRWSTPLLTLAAVAALAWVLYQRVEKAQLAKVDKAFAEYETAAMAGSPESLKAVADEYDRVRAVPQLSRLAAGDIYLQAARRGLRPGAGPKQDGSIDPADMLDDKGRDDMLGSAGALYQQVLTKTAADEHEAVHALSAAFGLAAVAESRGDTEGARKAYEQAASIAEKAGYAAQAETARKRIEDLPRLGTPKLLSKTELPTPPSPPPPPAPPALFPGLTGATGATGPTFVPPPAPTGSAPAAPPATGPTGAPSPTGTPAPTSPAPEAPTAPTGAPAPSGPPPRP